VIHNFQVITDAAKKSGFRFKIVTHPDDRVKEEAPKFNDAVKRYFIYLYLKK